MPLALDLISTLVMGSILPVATTLFARSPFSTLASFEGSILVPPLDAISAPATTKMRTTAAIDPQMIRLRRFFFALPLPLPSTTASCLISNLRLASPGVTGERLEYFLETLRVSHPAENSSAGGDGDLPRLRRRGKPRLYGIRCLFHRPTRT